MLEVCNDQKKVELEDLEEVVEGEIEEGNMAHISISAMSSTTIPKYSTMKVK